MPARSSAWLARLAVSPRLKGTLAPLAARHLSRDFTPRASLRVQIYGLGNRIGFSQAYPFLSQLSGRQSFPGIETRFATMERLLGGAAAIPEADVVLVQPWFDVNRAALVRSLTQVRDVNPCARLVLLDPCAHNDLRLARDVAPFIDAYVKKALFRDRSRYLRPTLGDTNLTEFYGARYGTTEAPVDWQVPREILSKLHIGPGFFTAPGLMERFLKPAGHFSGARPIDWHARLATRGAPWYAGMRSEALSRAQALPGLGVTGAGVSRARFLSELRRSKLVISPFGYGELCWRDIEGVLAGAVVVKQDVGHLETRPDLFRPWETYAPVRWDFADLPDVARRLLEDKALRERIAAQARQCIHDYLHDRLSRDLGDILTGGAVPDAPHEPSPAPQTLEVV